MRMTESELDASLTTFCKNVAYTEHIEKGALELALARERVLAAALKELHHSEKEGEK